MTRMMRVRRKVNGVASENWAPACAGVTKASSMGRATNLTWAMRMARGLFMASMVRPAAPAAGQRAAHSVLEAPAATEGTRRGHLRILREPS